MSNGSGTTTGKLQDGGLDCSAGDFCGRNRIWLRDGTLLCGTILSPRSGWSAPRLITPRRRQRTRSLADVSQSKPAKLTGRNRVKPRLHIHQTFVDGFAFGETQPARSPKDGSLEVQHCGDNVPRSFAHWDDFQACARSQRSRLRLESLFRRFTRAGATEVIVPDIYRRQSSRTEFSDCLLVQLPKSADRKLKVTAFAKVCATQLRTRSSSARFSLMTAILARAICIFRSLNSEDGEAISRLIHR